MLNHLYFYIDTGQFLIINDFLMGSVLWRKRQVLCAVDLRNYPPPEHLEI